MKLRKCFVGVRRGLVVTSLAFLFCGLLFPGQVTHADGTPTPTPTCNSTPTNCDGTNGGSGGGGYTGEWLVDGSGQRRLPLVPLNLQPGSGSRGFTGEGSRTIMRSQPVAL